MPRRILPSLFVFFLAVTLGLTGCSAALWKSAYDVSGWVIDSQGKGVEGVTIVFSGATSGSTQTDAAGNWRATLRGAVKITPLGSIGNAYAPAHLEVNSAFTAANFTLFKDHPLVLDETTAISDPAGTTLVSRSYRNTPQVQIKAGVLPPGTEITSQVLERIPGFQIDGPLEIAGRPLRLTLTGADLGAAALGEAVAIIRGPSDIAPDLECLGVFAGDSWHIYSPTISVGWWSAEIELENLELSKTGSPGSELELREGLIQLFTKRPGKKVSSDPKLSMKVYGFDGRRWSKKPIYKTGDQKTDFLIGSGEDIILFVHGLFGDYKVWNEAAGYFAYYYPDKELYAVDYELGYGLADLGKELANLIGLGVFRGEKINIVAHSQGGIISRVALEQFGAAYKVQKLVTLGTPHLGVDEAISVILKLQLSGVAPELGDLTAGSTLLTSLNGAAQSPQTEYYFAAGLSGKSYWVDMLTRRYYKSNLSDGLVSRDSALNENIAWVSARQSFRNLNHETLRTDRAVFEQIARWLELN